MLTLSKALGAAETQGQIRVKGEKMRAGAASGWPAGRGGLRTQEKRNKDGGMRSLNSIYSKGPQCKKKGGARSSQRAGRGGGAGGGANGRGRLCALPPLPRHRSAARVRVYVLVEPNQLLAAGKRRRGARRSAMVLAVETHTRFPTTCLAPRNRASPPEPGRCSTAASPQGALRQLGACKQIPLARDRVNYMLLGACSLSRKLRHKGAGRKQGGTPRVLGWPKAPGEGERLGAGAARLSPLAGRAGDPFPGAWPWSHHVFGAQGETPVGLDGLAAAWQVCHNLLKPDGPEAEERHQRSGGCGMGRQAWHTHVQQDLQAVQPSRQGDPGQKPWAPEAPVLDRGWLSMEHVQPSRGPAALKFVWKCGGKPSLDPTHLQVEMCLFGSPLGAYGDPGVLSVDSERLQNGRMRRIRHTRDSQSRSSGRPLWSWSPRQGVKLVRALLPGSALSAPAAKPCELAAGAVLADIPRGDLGHVDSAVWGRPGGNTRFRGANLHFPGSHGWAHHTCHSCFGSGDLVVTALLPGAQRRRPRSLHQGSGDCSYPPGCPGKPRPLQPTLTTVPGVRESRDHSGSCDSLGAEVHPLDFWESTNSEANVGEAILASLSSDPLLRALNLGSLPSAVPALLRVCLFPPTDLRNCTFWGRGQNANDGVVGGEELLCKSGQVVHVSTPPTSEKGARVGAAMNYTLQNGISVLISVISLHRFPSSPLSEVRPDPGTEFWSCCHHHQHESEGAPEGHSPCALAQPRPAPNLGPAGATAPRLPTPLPAGSGSCTPGARAGGRGAGGRLPRAGAGAETRLELLSHPGAWGKGLPSLSDTCGSRKPWWRLAELAGSPTSVPSPPPFCPGPQVRPPPPSQGCGRGPQYEVVARAAGSAGPAPPSFPSLALPSAPLGVFSLNQSLDPGSSAGLREDVLGPHPPPQPRGRRVWGDLEGRLQPSPRGNFIKIKIQSTPNLTVQGQVDQDRQNTQPEEGQKEKRRETWVAAPLSSTSPASSLVRRGPCRSCRLHPEEEGNQPTYRALALLGVEGWGGRGCLCILRCFADVFLECWEHINERGT
ncbi:hypothetical protein Cadr_000031070 [Camelus dromedarius]|uniref:Uncharacterized protein n=1 Tax=Camelus dromedarius TaxID=9838 RepID=A0A5N4BZS0_CAMDR|nr:hypothetical protein Cadr_000031070 [Camelus dromedarius]